MSVDPFDKYLSPTFRDTTFLKYVVFNSTDSSVFSSIIRENTFLLGKEELVSLMETFLVKKRKTLQVPCQNNLLVFLISENIVLIKYQSKRAIQLQCFLGAIFQW